MNKIQIIAEVGLLHNGQLALAKRLINEAARAGATVVKFQTHLAFAETLRNAPAPSYFKSESRFKYFERTAFNLPEWRSLKLHCRRKGVEFLSSPFSMEAVQLLEKVGISRYKIPSGEVTNIPLIQEIARTRKPILLSSGMSTWRELDAAVNLILKYHQKLIVMQCSSRYPCPLNQVGLNVMIEMKKRYDLDVGFSDHTMTNYAAFAAVALGAVAIEKHFMLNRSMYGSDAAHSIKPAQFSELVQGIRSIEVVLASKINKNDIRPYKEMKRIFEKSIVSVVEIPKGTSILKTMLGFKKPGSGIAPRQLYKVVGRKAARTIKPDALIQSLDLR